MRFTDKLKIAGYELMQGNAGNALKALTLRPAEYRGAQWFFEANGDQFFTWTGYKSSLNAYKRCPPIAAIVNRQAQAYVNGKTWVLNTKGKESNTPEAKKLKERLRQPNPIQNWKQFEAQGKIYQKLYGYNVVLIVKPFGFSDPLDALALWNITPWCEIEESPITSLMGVTKAKDLIRAVKFVYNGWSTDLNLDDLFIMKDLSASFETIFLPESPIVTLEMPINNIIGAMESENVMINNRGPMHVISSNKSDESGNVPLLPNEKQKLQDDFSRYGLRKGQWKQIITDANISVQSIGHSVRDLMLIESIAENSKICCDVLNYPAHLLGLIDPTFNNQNAAEKGLYQNAIIPDAENNYEQWNNLFKCEERNLKIEKDYSHITVLQDDKQAEAQARYTRNQALRIELTMDLIKVNRFLELNGEDAVTDGDVYYSKWKRIRGIEVPQNIINGTDATQTPNAA